MIKIIPMKYDESLIPFNGDCWVAAFDVKGQMQLLYPVTGNNSQITRLQ